MKLSRFVNELVQNSECFSFEAYLQGLKRFIQNEALEGKIGSIQTKDISKCRMQEDPIALLLGETNRINKRYPLIECLLNKNETQGIKESEYYKTLFRYYENKNILERVKGHREITRKVLRILKINQWLVKHRDFHGLHSYLLGKNLRVCNSDFPILVEVKNKEGKCFDVQLDGSHRRCVALYNQLDTVSSLVINYDEIKHHLGTCGEPYLSKYFEKFNNVITKF